MLILECRHSLQRHIITHPFSFRMLKRCALFAARNLFDCACNLLITAAQYNLFRQVCHKMGRLFDCFVDFRLRFLLAGAFNCSHILFADCTSNYIRSTIEFEHLRWFRELCFAFIV